MHFKNHLDKYGNKSRKFEVLGTRGIFRIFSSSNYKEVDIKVITPLPSKMNIFRVFFLANIMFCVRNRNTLGRRFFYAFKTYVL